MSDFQDRIALQMEFQRLDYELSLVNQELQGLGALSSSEEMKALRKRQDALKKSVELALLKEQMLEHKIVTPRIDTTKPRKSIVENLRRKPK